MLRQLLAGLILVNILACNINTPKFTVELNLWPNTPQFIKIPEHLQSYTDWSLINLNDQTPVPVQKFDEKQLVFFNQNRSGQQQFKVIANKADTPTKTLGLKESKDRIEINIEGKPVLAYQKTSQLPSDTIPAYYKRSGFIHPVYSPSGQILTDGFPVGHTHQHGIFFAWVNTNYRGQKTDFWNQQNKTGTVRHVEILETRSGAVFAQIKAKLEHVQITEADTIPALNEIWTITVYQHSDPFIIDLKSIQYTSGTDTLYLNKYHYGGMAYRGTHSWNSSDPGFKDSMQVLTSTGINRAQANHTRPNWITGFGKINDQFAGLAIFSHKDNFRFPQHVRVHPEMPYFCFIPAVDSGFSINPGDLYTSNYRLISYDGRPDEAVLNNQWEAYAQ